MRINTNILVLLIGLIVGTNLSFITSTAETGIYVKGANNSNEIEVDSSTIQDGSESSNNGYDNRQVKLTVEKNDHLSTDSLKDDNNKIKHNDALKVFIPGGRITTETFRRLKEEESIWTRIPGFEYFLTFIERLSLGYRLLLFAGLFAFFFLMNIVFVALVVVITNWNKNRKEKWYTSTRRHVIDVLSPLLFNPDEVKTHDQELAEHTLEMLSKTKEKQVIIDVLMEARRNLTGNSISVLSEVYSNLHLDKVSKSDIKSFSWFRKVVGLRELSYLGEQLEVDGSILPKYINKRNQNVRLEAILGFLITRKEEPLVFLDYLNRPLTRWIQLSAYYTMYFNNVVPPLLGKYLKVENPQVVIWCLRLIAIYNQVEEVRAVTGCLVHNNERVRKAAVQTSLALENWRVKEMLKKRYRGELLDVKQEILKLVGHFVGEKDVDFLLTIIYEGTFTEVRESVRILYRMDEKVRADLLEADRLLLGRLAPFVSHVAEPLNQVII